MSAHRTHAIACSPGEPFQGRGWYAYLLTAALLVPLLVPSLPAKLAVLDLLNFAAFACFAGLLVLHRLRPVLLFGAPALLIAIGSLVALVNATNPSAGLMAIAQDVYLFLWFVLLVTVMVRTPGLKGMRVAWLVAATLVALYSLYEWTQIGSAAPTDLLEPEGNRVKACFNNANILAQYLVISVFIGLGLVGQVRRALLLPAIGLLLVALIMTKSNGGLLSLGVGLVVWYHARAWATAVPVARLAGQACLALAAALAFAWLVGAGGAGASLARKLEEHTLLGRVDKSSHSRQKIWTGLLGYYEHSPLGLGPGNSAFQLLPIGKRQTRYFTFLSAEPHNDYISYMVERGPLGLVGLLLGTVAAFRLVARGRARIAATAGGVLSGATLWASLLGGLAALSMHSFVIEKMHFRHFWLFLALACALAIQGPRAQARGLAHAGDRLPLGAGGVA